MSINKAIARYYDGMTVFYQWFYSPAGLHYGLWKRGTFTLRQALFNHKAALLRALAPVDPDSRVLDAGCGTGQTALHFHRLAGCRVTGVTLSEDQIRRARRASIRQGADERVQFLEAEFTRTGLPDGHFTGAIASESFCHAEDKAAFLREMHRVLEPGGRLVIADFFLDRPDEALDEEQRHYHERVKKGFVISGFASRDEVRSDAERAGFRPAGDVDLTRAVRRTAYHIQFRAVLSLPFAYLLRALRLAPPELIPHLWCCAAQPGALRSLGTYRLITLDKPL